MKPDQKGVQSGSGKAADVTHSHHTVFLHNFEEAVSCLIILINE